MAEAEAAATAGAAGTGAGSPVREKDEPSRKDALRITQQFRERGGMTYDFSVGGATFTVRVFARQNATDAGDWRVELTGGRAEQALQVEAWGATRIDALRVAGSSWAEDPRSRDLARPDWTAVEKALQTVRAV